MEMGEVETVTGGKTMSVTNRREFIRDGGLAAGILAAGGAPQPTAQAKVRQEHQHEHPNTKEYPRDHAGPGGPVGGDTDRGRLVPGRRAAGEPVSIEAPDLGKLP